MRPTADSGTLQLSAILLALTLGACRGATAPASAAGLTLETQASDFDTNAGVLPRLTYTLRNDSDAPRTLVFTGCGVLPYIETRSGRIIHPPNGTWVCAPEVSTVTLDPGGTIVSSHYVAARDAAAPDETTVFLPSGVYRAYAEVEFHLDRIDGERIELRSRRASDRHSRAGSRHSHGC